MKPEVIEMPPVICLTLVEEKWKRQQLERHFLTQGIEAHYVDGMQGVTLGLKATNPHNYNEKGEGLFIHVSQIGCALSHRICLSFGLTSGWDDFGS